LAAVPAHQSLYYTGNRTSLPIGNYNSQFLVNVYLDPLDQFVKHTLRERFYLHHVDDLLFRSRSPERLRECEVAITQFLEAAAAAPSFNDSRYSEQPPPRTSPELWGVRARLRRQCSATPLRRASLTRTTPRSSG